MIGVPRLEATRAYDLIQALACGVDPHSGEEYPTQSPYQHPDTIRALFVALRYLEPQAQKEKRRASQPANAGKPWTREQDQQLAESFDTGTKPHKLAEQMHRSRSAVVARLIKLGKMTPEEGGFTPRFGERVQRAGTVVANGASPEFGAPNAALPAN